MLVAESRPRNLRWFHAGPLLYGDWGTSRLYVLGLAYFYTSASSIFYLAAIGALMTAVAWAYTIVCRAFPDGGGVYSAARQLNPTLAVVGATLLLCGYIITAAISVVEAFHYFGVPDSTLLVVLSTLVIAGIGAVNWLGARSAGTFALVVAFAAIAVSFVLALLCLPFVPAGLSQISMTGTAGPWPSWVAFTQIVLALAGVEAVANLTGLMRPPVPRTAKRTIWPVLVEVVVLNLVFGVALLGLVGASDPSFEIRNTAMKVVGIRSGQYWLGETAGWYLGKGAAIVFGLLLLSAANTAIMAMVSVLYAMAQERELPRGLAKLNYSGVPWIGLIVSCVVAAVVIALERDLSRLAELYIIGVCGAITTNLLACAANRKLPIRRGERAGLWALGLFLAAITATIVVTLPNATLFAGGVVAVVLTTRGALAWRQLRMPPPLPEPAMGWLAEVQREPIKLDPSRPRIMLAARGRYQSEFAVDLARRRGATLFAIYVRTLRVLDMNPGRVPRVEEDRDAQEALGTTALLAREAGVPFIPIYVTSTDIASEILDYTVTYGCDTLIMGKSRRSLFARTIEGDVVSQVAQSLPDEVALITRSPDTPHIGRPQTRSAGAERPAAPSGAPESSDAPPPT